MQKFNGGEKVNKVKGYKFPGKVVAVFKPSNGEWRYVVEMDNYGLLHIFNGDQLELEGELLEGGTVEKCKGCKFCLMSEYKTGEECRKNRACWCHNKKEQKHEHATGVVCTLDCFNRETSKCTSSHPMKDGKCAVTDGVRTCVCKCSYCPSVPLPEKLDRAKASPMWVTDILIWDTINQIIDYLASKENK